MKFSLLSSLGKDTNNMNMEMPKNYDGVLKIEVDRIIKKYPDRLKAASSILDETQKIMQEEGTTDPELKRLLPLEVMATIRKTGKYKTFKKIENNNSMSKYAEEARRASYFIEKREQEK